MEGAASAAMRRCLRSGRTLRCRIAVSHSTSASTSGAKLTCIATSICPARNISTISTTSSYVDKSPRTFHPTRPGGLQTPTFRSPKRGYSSHESSIAGTIGQGAATIPEDQNSASTAPTHLNEKEKAIWEMLMKALEPTKLEVQDISGGCGSMYGIDVVSERFRGLGMLKQQRLVNEVLGDEIKGWHGVQLKTRAP